MDLKEKRELQKELSKMSDEKLNHNHDYVDAKLDVIKVFIKRMNDDLKFLQEGHKVYIEEIKKRNKKSKIKSKRRKKWI